MSQYNTGIKAFTSGEALEARCRVKMSSATVVYADAGEDFIGVTEHACASGDVVSVKLKNVSGTFKVQAAGAFDSETVLYGAADGCVDDTESGSAQFYSLEAATAAGDIVEALPWNVSAGMGSIDIDKGYNLTLGAFNSTTQGYGAPLSHTNTGDVRFYSDDVGTAFASGSVPDVRGMLSRMLITTSQATNPVRIYGAMGHVKSYANGTGKIAEWDNEQVGGVYGYLELVRNAGTVVFDSYGVSAGVIGCVETSGTMTVNTYHTIAGLAAISKLTSDLTQTGKTAGVYVGIYDTTNWSDGSTARSKWGYGLFVQGSAVSNGAEIGNTTTPVTLAATTNYGLSIATTAAFVTASEYDAVKINAVQTGAAAIPVALRVNLESNVKLGSWANAIYASVDLKTAGGAAGMASAICGELTMGAGATEGTFGVLEAEVNCPTSWTGTGPVSYLYLNSYGATKANFDTYGNFMWLTGATGASGKFLSATSQTVRCYVGTANRYLFLSQIEDGVGLGTSGSPMTLGTTPVMSVYTTNANTSTEVDAVKFNSVFTAAGGIDVGLRVNMECNYKMGNWANAAYVSLDLKTNGGVAGLGTVLCSELVMGAAATEGTFGVFEGEISCPASWTGTGPVSFLYLNAYGSTVTNFDTYGYLFTLTGVTSGSGSMWYDHQGTAPAQTEEWIRVKTPGGDRYIALYNAVV